MKHYLVKHKQKKACVCNSFEPKGKTGKKLLGNGCTLYHDIPYGSRFPNGFLDIYAQPDAGDKGYCTYFYIHGGGYALGDKTDGDPNAKGDDHDWFFLEFMKAGYNIVSVNYALAPEYFYPTPIIQIGEAVKFLKAYGLEYGIRMDRIIMGGGSAGGQLAGQFVNIQTNAAYAEEMGMKAVLDRGDIKAVLFNSALLDNERFGKTDSAAINFLFIRCGRAYFNSRKLSGNQRVIQSDVIKNVTEEFPPSFLSDGNLGSFTDQNRDLATRLSQLHVKNVLNIYSKTEAKLGHAFEFMGDKYGRENLKKMLDFLEELGVNQ